MQDGTAELRLSRTLLRHNLTTRALIYLYYQPDCYIFPLVFGQVTKTMKSAEYIKAHKATVSHKLPAVSPPLTLYKQIKWNDISQWRCSMCCHTKYQNSWSDTQPIRLEDYNFFVKSNKTLWFRALSNVCFWLVERHFVLVFQWNVKPALLNKQTRKNIRGYFNLILAFLCISTSL